MTASSEDRLKMSKCGRICAVGAALALVAVLFLPVWSINLIAPQYPEGLGLTIWMTDITGQDPHDLGKINNLNHYIGMKAIKPNEIPELVIMPVVLGGLSLLALIAGVTGNLRLMRWWLLGLILFAIIGMGDFYRWGYDYGHSLDPSAPIKVPGMSYQPPLIGSKKLLNFTAQSLPHVGTGAAVLAGILGALSIWCSLKNVKRCFAFLLLCSLASCSDEPRALRLGVDTCTHCHMVVSDAQYAAQLVTSKGKTLIFDSLDCIRAYTSRSGEEGEIWIADFFSKGWVKAKEMHFVRSRLVKGPMGGDIVAFGKGADAEKFAKDVGSTEIFTWDALPGIEKHVHPHH